MATRLFYWGLCYFLILETKNTIKFNKDERLCPVAKSGYKKLVVLRLNEVQLFIQTLVQIVHLGLGHKDRNNK